MEFDRLVVESLGIGNAKSNFATVAGQPVPEPFSDPYHRACQCLPLAPADAAAEAGVFRSPALGRSSGKSADQPPATLTVIGLAHQPGPPQRPGHLPVPLSLAEILHQRSF